LTGKRVYALGESSSAKTVLETLRDHRITLMNFTPRLLGQLKQALIDGAGTVPEEKRKEYAGWFKGLDEIRCSGGVIDRSSMSFWVDLTGLPFQIIYTGTEMGGPAIVTREHPQAMVSPIL
jgi:malonyl-CoA/methylmalonyl-CoA synthetase